MKRFTVKGEIDAETVNHAMLSLAAHLVTVRAELEADQTGEPGPVVAIEIKPKRGRREP